MLNSFGFLDDEDSDEEDNEEDEDEGVYHHDPTSVSPSCRLAGLVGQRDVSKQASQ